VFYENSNAGKAKFNKIYLFTTTVDRFYRNKHLDHKRGKHYFHTPAEMNKNDFQCSALSSPGLN